MRPRPPATLHGAEHRARAPRSPDAPRRCARSRRAACRRAPRQHASPAPFTQHARRRPRRRASASVRAFIAGARRARASVRLLQRRRAAHERVGDVDRHFGDALRCRRGSACAAATRRDAVGERAATSAPPRQAVPHLLDGLGVEARQPEQVAQHAQHLPARRAFAQRLHHGVEACTRPSMLTKVPAVSVKGAIGSSTCAYSSVVLPGRQRDDELGAAAAPRARRAGRRSRARARRRAAGKRRGFVSTARAVRAGAARAGEIAADASWRPRRGTPTLAPERRAPARWMQPRPADAAARSCRAGPRRSCRLRRCAVAASRRRSDAPWPRPASRARAASDRARDDAGRPASASRRPPSAARGSARRASRPGAGGAR